MGSPLESARVLFLCTYNSARSQMTEGHLRTQGGKNVQAFSAGSQVTSVRPEALSAMANLGVDLTKQSSKHLDQYAGQAFDYVITVCDRVREICPAFSGAKSQLHWSIPDPVAIPDESERLKAFNEIAQDLGGRVRSFLQSELQVR